MAASGMRAGPPVTAAFEPQVGTFAAPNPATVLIPLSARMDLCNFSGAVVTLTLGLRLGGTVPVTLPANKVLSLDGRLFSSCNNPGQVGLLLWAFVTQDLPVNVWGDSSTQASFNVQDSAQMTPVLIAAGTPETTEVTGAVTNPVGRLIRYQLTVGDTLGAAICYAALKLHTAGTYLAVVSAGSSSGAVRMPTADTIDVVVRNADAVAHTMAGSYSASGGE